MLINEIEITGASFGFQRLIATVDDTSKLFTKLMSQDGIFDLEAETPGVHDVDHNNDVIRGFFSAVVPFEVEHLVEGISTKTLLKRIESCEFILTRRIAIAFGQNNPTKLFQMFLSTATGCCVDKAEYDYPKLYRLQERLSKVSNIALLNPKTTPIRKAKLAGNIEHYAEYDCVNRSEHVIDYVQGMVNDTPIGSLKLKVAKNGRINLGVRRGTIVPVETLEWLIEFIEKDSVELTKEPTLF